jgi:hypothetical protein
MTSMHALSGSKVQWKSRARLCPLAMTILEIAATTVIFFFGELALSRVLFWFRLRDRRY